MPPDKPMGWEKKEDYIVYRLGSASLTVLAKMNFGGKGGDGMHHMTPSCILLTQESVP